MLVSVSIDYLRRDVTKNVIILNHKRQRSLMNVIGRNVPFQLGITLLLCIIESTLTQNYSNILLSVAAMLQILAGNSIITRVHKRITSEGVACGATHSRLGADAKILRGEFCDGDRVLNKWKGSQPVCINW